GFHHRPAWSLEDLVFRLRDRAGRLAELRLGDRSVAAQFELSYRKLTPPQRRLFRVLGGTAQPGEEFDAGTAALLVNLPVREVERLLEELFDAHMLSQRP